MKTFLKILFIALWVCVGAGAVLLLLFSNQKHNNKFGKNVDCVIDYRGQAPLLAPTDIITDINAKFGKPSQQTLNKIDIAGINSMLHKNPYLENTDVLLTIEGNVSVKAQQCQPIIRCVTPLGKNLFIGSNGRIMPVNTNYPYKALFANGELSDSIAVGVNLLNVPENAKKTRARLKNYYSLYYVGNIIQADSTLRALIEQVYIHNNGDMDLITKAGSHKIAFGDTAFAAEKFENLKYFYQKGLSRAGWDKYKLLTLKYRNQIVCTK